jgi:HK97 family phage prohead protease
MTLVDDRAQMTAASINDLSDSDFAYIEPGGTKDSSGKTTPRSLRHFPIHDAAHVRNALARMSQSPFGDKAKGKIMAAAKKFGIDMQMNSRPDLGLCIRAFDFETRGRAGDGRTLEGYAAVYNSPARIRDFGGDFDEVILPGAFTRSLQQRTPVMQWEHGKDPRVGTVPIATIEEINPEDPHGLYVRARLFDNPVIEPVRQAIAAGAVRGMSFRFGVPEKGDTWTRRVGNVDLREIRDADTSELGPVVFPAYDATSVSVRSLLAQLDPDEHRALIRELAAELRHAVDLEDLTGRSAQGAGGGDPDTEPGNGVVPQHQLPYDTLIWMRKNDA